MPKFVLHGGMIECLDVKQGIEFTVSEDGKTAYVNADGECVCRFWKLPEGVKFYFKNEGTTKQLVDIERIVSP